jgi:hypothetical protein
MQSRNFSLAYRPKRVVDQHVRSPNSNMSKAQQPGSSKQILVDHYLIFFAGTSSGGATLAFARQAKAGVWLQNLVLEISRLGLIFASPGQI